MKPILTLALFALAFFTSSCGGNPTTIAARGAATLSEEEKHRLYSAALAANESPLDTELFKDVCKKIGVFYASGKPNDTYLAFVSRHVEWGMKSESDQFRREINTKQRAQDYVGQHLPR